MKWSVSSFRPGDLVQVRSKEEILATLDASASTDGMMFMPEMLAHCGETFRVSASAHKTCDTVTNRGGLRLSGTVHLEGLRCDGSAHGGCQAECNLFWRDQWLKPVEAGGESTKMSPSTTLNADWLFTATQASSDSGGPRYRCQATELLRATTRLPWWNLRQYVLDITTGNHSGAHTLRMLALAAFRRFLRRTPFAYKAVEDLCTRTHMALTGRPLPYVVGRALSRPSASSSRADLISGDLVRIRSKSEIEATVDESGRNRGLSFDKEMTRYCGTVARVRKAVAKIIDESTGRMIYMKHPCIMLEGIMCTADYSESRLLCPRAITPYWRDTWLERLPADSVVADASPKTASRDASPA